MGKNREHSKFPNAITVLDNGNVGIGTTTPFGGLAYAAGLHIKVVSNNSFLRLTSSTYTGIDLIQLTDGNAVLWNRDNGYLAFGTNDLERFRITSSGNFIIGTGVSTTNITTYIYSTAHGTNPGLWVRCVTNEVPASLFNDGNSKAMLGFKGSTTANEYNVRCGADANDFVTYTSNTERLRITSAGVLQMGGSSYNRNALQSSNFGYNGVYRTLIVGSTGTNYSADAVSLAFNVDVSGNSSGSFTGAGSEYIWRNTGSFITPNSSNNGFNTLMGWNTNGIITHPSQPSFYATSNVGSTDYASGEVIVFNTTRHNTGSHYNTSNGRFTAPVTGKYLFSLNAYAYSSYRFSITLTVNGSQYTVQDLSPLAYHETTVGEMTTGFTIIWELSAGDYVEVRTRVGYTSRIYRAHSHFSGQLLS